MQWVKSWLTSPRTFDEPWRSIPWGNKEIDLQFVKDYQTHNENVQELRILLHGPTGSGKSSFINSVFSVLQGRITGPALADSITEASFTQTYKRYPIQTGRQEAIAFTDIMGLERGSSRGVCVDDIKLAMMGHINNGYKFNPQSKITKGDNFYKKNPTPQDCVHVLVCVVSAATLSILSAEFVAKMREVRLAARDLGIPQVAILTKIDEACPEVGNDIKNVYKSKYLKKKMEELSAALGIPLYCIFPVKNYHSEIDTDEDTDTLILSALRCIINFGDDFVTSLETSILLRLYYRVKKFFWPTGWK